jgi:hypothetical protein
LFNSESKINQIIYQLKKGNLSILDNQVFQAMDGQVKMALQMMTMIDPSKRISSKKLVKFLSKKKILRAKSVPYSKFRDLKSIYKNCKFHFQKNKIRIKKEPIDNHLKSNLRCSNDTHGKKLNEIKIKKKAKSRPFVKKFSNNDLLKELKVNQNLKSSRLQTRSIDNLKRNPKKQLSLFKKRRTNQFNLKHSSTKLDICSTHLTNKNKKQVGYF